MVKDVEQDDGRKSRVKSVKKPNSKEGFEKNEHACSVEEVFDVSDSTAHPYLKLSGLTRTNKILSKLRHTDRQFRNRQAEIPDTPLGLTGMASRRTGRRC